MTSRSFVEKHLYKRSLLSYALLPLSLVFSLILSIRRIFYALVLPRYQAPVFIISIGNIVAGGSGKTPFTVYFAELLSQNGFKVAVSHRGYKSELENGATLISDATGLLPFSEKAGDEARLLAQRLQGIPVVAGKDRTEAIKLLCMKFSDLNCVILDDSFQHLKVIHDLDIIIISNELGFGNGFVLPAGYLREKKSVLKNADLLILNCLADSDEPNSTIRQTLSETGKEIYKGSYRLDRIYDFSGSEVSITRLMGQKVMLLAGIGNPASFVSLIHSLNLKESGHMFLPDHADYDSKTLRKEILSLFKETAADWILTTEKDYVKLNQYEEFAGILLTVRISFVLSAEDEKLLNYLKTRLTADRI